MTMTEDREPAAGRRSSRWRIAPWVIAAGLLLLPAVAMRFTAQVAWGPEDFLIFGVMLFAACGAFELAARATDNVAYRAAVGLSLVTAFLVIWVNLAVGIIGGGNHPANLMFFGVVAIAGVGAAIGNFQPRGMARAMSVTAIAQAVVAVIALALGPIEAFVLTAFIVAPWLIAACLFQVAARVPFPVDKPALRRTR
jgi:hypothetical protein